MRILLATGTNMEVKLFLTECQFLDAFSDNHKKYRFRNTEFEVLTTGMGTTFATFHLSQVLLQRNFDLVINAGIAGSLTEDLQIGDVIQVVDEEFADLGIEEEDEFLTLFDSGFMNPGEFPFENRILKSDKLTFATWLPRVKGITANISHGRKSSIARLKAQFSGQVESMEGAAVLYVCRWLGVSCIQVRAVSNYVAPRNIAHWDIPLALDNLKDTLARLLEEIGRQVS